MSRHQRFLCSAVLVCGFAGVVYAEGVVGNAGFEGQTLSPWQFAAMGGAKAAGAKDTRVFHSGTAAIRVTNESGQKANTFGMLSQSLKVKPNTQYELSVWSKGTKVGNAWIGGGAAWDRLVRFPAGTYDWQKFTGSFLTGPKETTFNLIAVVESETEALWVDDVEVTAVGTLSPEEYTVTEKSLAPAEAVGAFLRSEIPYAMGVCVFGFPPNPGELGQLAATGVKVVRTDLHWAEAEPQKGKFDEEYWKTVTGWVDSYAKYGIRMLLILDYGNPAYGGEWGEIPKTTERRLAFARFAAEAAKRFKGRSAMFELWNEPDGSVTAEEYMALAKVTIPAMRTANPEVVIVGPAAHHYAMPWIEKCLKYGLLNLFDAVSVHLYFGMPPAPQPKPELNGPLVEDLRRLVTKYAGGRTVPIVNSEWGYKRLIAGGKPEQSGACVSTEDNAKYVSRVFLLSQVWDLKFNIWFCWWLPDEATHRDGDYGLVSPDLMPMPAYYAMKNLAEQLSKGRFKSRIDVGSKDDFVLQFDTSKGSCVAAWTCGKGHSISVPVGASKKVVVTSFDGSRSYTLTPDAAGMVRLEISDGVQYLRPER